MAAGAASAIDTNPVTTDVEPVDLVDESEEPDENESVLATSEQKHPYDGLSDQVLRDALKTHPEALGSISIGSPNAGQLINGVRPPVSSVYHLVDPEHAWGTEETVRSLCHALEKVAHTFPDTPIVDIGHLSARNGGHLKPHRSHQSGRDVDVGLYYSQKGTRWYTRADGDNLDVPRTWTLIETLAKETDIEMILLDHQLQKLIEAYALTVESDADWVRGLFHANGVKPPLLRHSPGHATHLHLRFKNPIARRSASRLAPMLAGSHPAISVVRKRASITHLAKPGETLAQLAKRYHTTMSAIRSANKLRTYQIIAGHTYKIPIEQPTNDKNRDCGSCRVPNKP